MKCFYSKFFLLLALVFNSFAVNAQTITIDSPNGVEGTSIAVSVDAESITDLTAFQWTIDYDPTKLTYTGCTNWATGTSVLDVTINDDGAGKLTFAYNNYPTVITGIDPSGKFFDLNFDIAGGTSGTTTTLVWSDDPTVRELSNTVPAEIIATWNNGTITINAANPTLSIEHVIGSPGNPVLVPVNALDLYDINAFQWTIEYDATQLTYVSVTNWAAGVNTAELVLNDDGAGKLTFAYNDYPNGFDIADGKFFDLNFNVDAAASGVTPLVWSDVPTARELSNSVPEVIIATWNSGSINNGRTWLGVVSSDWHTANNWSPPVVPTLADNVVIPEVDPANYYPVINNTTTAECADMIIEVNAVLTVGTIGKLTVHGTMQNNNGIDGLIVKSDATGTGSLILNSPAQGTVERFLNKTTTTQGQWFFIGSPVSSAPLSMFNLNNFYYYNEGVDDWWTGPDYYYNGGYGWQVPGTDLSVGTGYIYYYYQTTLAYTGDLNYSETGYTFNVNYTEHPGDAANSKPYTEFDGWNLLSNPYHSAIDWLKVGKTGLNNSVYYYDGSADNYVYYIDNGDGSGSGANGGSQFIPMGQGFFVKADNTAGGQLDIPNNARTHAADDFFKSNKRNSTADKYGPATELRFNINTNVGSDEGLIQFRKDRNTKAIYDGRYDAYKRFSWNEVMPQVYALSADESLRYAITSISPGETTQVVSLGYKLPENTEYTIQFSEFYDYYYDYLYLEDSKENKYVDLSKNSDYTFIAEKGLTDDRLKLHFGVNQPPAVTGEISDQFVTAESLFFLDVSGLFEDYDLLDEVTYIAEFADGTQLPNWLEFDAENKIFKGTPQNANFGSSQIVLKGRDNYGGSSQISFLLTVREKNYPPYIENPIDDQTAAYNRQWDFVIPANTFGDPNYNNQLTYTADYDAALDNWLHFDEAKQTFNAQPKNEHEGEYYLKVNVTDQLGETVSDSFRLQVVKPMEIAEYSREISACEDDELTITIEASGTNIKYQWYFEGEQIPDAVSAHYSISNVRQTHAGSYSCLVSDDYFEKMTDDMVLSLFEPINIYSHPSDINAVYGSTIVFSIGAEGSILDYQWRLDGNELEFDENILGVDTEALVIHNFTAEHEGIYDVIIFGECGQLVSGSASLNSDASKVEETAVGINLFPNPVNDILNITWDDEQYYVDIEFIDAVTGQLLFKDGIQKPQNLKFDISFLASGVYFVKISTDDSVETYKFVKQ